MSSSGAASTGPDSVACAFYPPPGSRLVQHPIGPSESRRGLLARLRVGAKKAGGQVYRRTACPACSLSPTVSGHSEAASRATRCPREGAGPSARLLWHVGLARPVGRSRMWPCWAGGRACKWRRFRHGTRARQSLHGGGLSSPAGQRSASKRRPQSTECLAAASCAHRIVNWASALPDVGRREAGPWRRFADGCTRAPLQTALSAPQLALAGMRRVTLQPLPLEQLQGGQGADEARSTGTSNSQAGNRWLCVPPRNCGGRR